MIHYIENNCLKVGVKEFGAELTSVTSKETGSEFMWQGNPDIWSGQSPILFPIIGRLIDDRYTLDGKEYEMPKHGFARRMPWECIEKTADSVSFLLKETADTLKIYPFSFEFTVTFSLESNKLSVIHRVKNTGENEMYFSLGAHPAFNCKIGDRLVFEKNETLDKIKIDLVNSLRLPEAFPLLRDEREIVITEDVFNEDALITSNVQSDSITLVSDGLGRKITFTLGNAPFLGIWAKPGAPYVCIEPWYGVNDKQNVKVDFSEKEGIIALHAKEKFEFIWSAQFTE